MEMSFANTFGLQICYPHVFGRYGDEVIATHQKLIGTGRQRTNPAHYQGLFSDRLEKKKEEPPRFDPWWKDEEVMIRDLDIYDHVANL